MPDLKYYVLWITFKLKHKDSMKTVAGLNNIQLDQLTFKWI